MHRPGFKSLRFHGLVCLSSKTKSVLTYARYLLVISPPSSVWSSGAPVLHLNLTLIEILRSRQCAFSRT